MAVMGASHHSWPKIISAKPEVITKETNRLIIGGFCVARPKGLEPLTF